MKLFKSLALAAIVMTAAAAPPALAQSSGAIAVIDFTRIAAESSAGKSVNTGAQSVGRQVEAELKPESDGINTEWQSIRTSLLQANPQLKQRIDTLDKQLAGSQRPDAQQAQQAQQVQNEFLRLLNDEAGKNPTLRSRLETFGKRVEAQQLRQRRAQVEVQATLQKADQDLGTAIRAAAQDAMSARGAVVVLDKDSVVVNAATIDITGDVISRLNSRTPSIAVVRQRIPQQ